MIETKHGQPTVMSYPLSWFAPGQSIAQSASPRPRTWLWIDRTSPLRGGL